MTENPQDQPAEGGQQPYSGQPSSRGAGSAAPSAAALLRRRHRRLAKARPTEPAAGIWTGTGPGLCK